MSQPGEYQPERPISAQRGRKPEIPGRGAGLLLLPAASAGNDDGSTDPATTRRRWSAGRRFRRLRRPLRHPAAGAGVPPADRERGVEPDHPHHRGTSAVPPVGIRTPRRQARRHHRHPQLRPRRVGDLALLGHRTPGGRNGARTPEPAGRRDRLRSGGTRDRASAPTPRLRRHDLRHVGTSEHHVEHGLGGVHPGRLAGRRQHADARVRRSVPGRRRDLLSRVPVAGRKGVRGGLARPLHGHRHRAARSVSQPETSPPGTAPSRPPDQRPVPARPRRTSFSHPIRNPAQLHADRAGHLSGRAGPRFQGLRRADRDPQVQGTPRNSSPSMDRS